MNNAMKLLLAVGMMVGTASAAITSTTTHDHGTLAVPGVPVSSIVAGDLLESATGVQSNPGAGWHGAAPPEPERFQALNDGTGPLSGLTGLMNDFAGAPVNTFSYQLAAPSSIDKIQVVTGNFGGDGRIFSTFVVEASTNGGANWFGVGGAGGSGYYQSDPSGAINVNGNGANISGEANNPYEETLVEIFDDGGGYLATGVTDIRFLFFSVDNTGGQMRDPYDGVNPYTGVDDLLSAAFVSPLVWEIDVTPEPASLVLVAFGGLALLRRRRA